MTLGSMMSSSLKRDTATLGHVAGAPGFAGVVSGRAFASPRGLPAPVPAAPASMVPDGQVTDDAAGSVWLQSDTKGWVAGSGAR